jgi:hypothetical protein
MVYDTELFDLQGSTDARDLAETQQEVPGHHRRQAVF